MRYIIIMAVSMTCAINNNCVRRYVCSLLNPTRCRVLTALLLYLCTRCRDISFIFISLSKDRDAYTARRRFKEDNFNFCFNTHTHTHAQHTYVLTTSRGDGNLFNGKLSTYGVGAFRSPHVNPSVNRFRK